MFICASWGMLMPALRPPHTVPDGDLQTIQIRTRRKKDLEILRDKYMSNTLGEIQHTPNMDYNYRAYCTPADLGIALMLIAQDINYVKFKETAKTQYEDASLYNVYNSFWGTATQLGAPYEGQKFGDWDTGTYVGKSYGKKSKAGNWVFTDEDLASLWERVKDMDLVARKRWLFPHERLALSTYLPRVNIDYRTGGPYQPKSGKGVRPIPKPAGVRRVGKNVIVDPERATTRSYKGSTIIK